jgi:hypothetical protein
VNAGDGQLVPLDANGEPHLRHLVERLALPRVDLRQLLLDKAAHMRFFCYWDNENGDRTPDLPDDIRAMMEATSGTVEIDDTDSVQNITTEGDQRRPKRTARFR